MQDKLFSLFTVRCQKNLKPMKKVCGFIGALVVFDIALFGINQFREWRDIKPAAASVSESAVSAPVRAEQKTYRVTFRVAPEVQSQAKNQ